MIGLQASPAFTGTSIDFSMCFNRAAHCPNVRYSLVRFSPAGKAGRGNRTKPPEQYRGFAVGLLGACNTIQGAPDACANKRPADTGLLGYVFNSCHPAFKLDKLSIDTDIPVFPYWEWHCGPPFLGFTTLEPCARYSRRAMRWPLWGGAVFLCCGLIIA